MCDMRIFDKLFKGKGKSPQPWSWGERYKIYIEFIQIKHDEKTSLAVTEEILKTVRTVQGGEANAIARAMISSDMSGDREDKKFRYALKQISTKYGISTDKLMKLIEECNTEYTQTIKKAKNGSEEAIKYFEALLQINREFVDAWIDMGNTLYLLKRYDEAIGCYDKALAIEPNNKNVKENKEKAIQSKGSRS